MEINTGFNGTTYLPVKKRNGMVIPDAPLSALHEDAQRIMQEQVEYGVRAEEYGYDRVYFVEHHFHYTGAERSPNPLMIEMAIAAQTDEIRLMQLGNIVPWHEPIRLAESTAILDVISDGRAEIGIGRGFAPFEAEVLGQYWGGGVGDQEMNRKTFEEKYEILLNAWTEDLFSYHGDFHDVPPGYVPHDYPKHLEYFEDDVTEYELDDLVEQPEDPDEPPKLKALSVFPQPLQEPYPQLWQPTLSDRSARWAARRGINSYSVVGTYENVENKIDVYQEAAEAAGWPDRREEYAGEPLRRGWDEEKGRGVVCQKTIFNTDVGSEEAFERWLTSREAAVSGLVASGHRTEEEARATFGPEANPICYGTADDIIDDICETKEACGYDDFCISVWFEGVGMQPEDHLEQLEAFSEQVMPYLREEYPSP